MEQKQNIPNNTTDHSVDKVIEADKHTEVGTTKNNRLGLIALVLMIIGLVPISFILGLVGVSRAKKTNSSRVLARSVWIISLVIMIVAMAGFGWVLNKAAIRDQAATRDFERTSDIDLISARLETYFATNFGYPNDLDDFAKDITSSLLSPNGKTIQVNAVVATEEAARQADNPNADIQYTYTAYGRANCLDTCDGYVLKSYTETNESGLTNPYVVLGQHNL